MESPEMSLNTDTILNSPGTAWLTSGNIGLAHIDMNGMHQGEVLACVSIQHPYQYVQYASRRGKRAYRFDWFQQAVRWFFRNVILVPIVLGQLSSKLLNYQYPNFTTSCNSYCVHCKEVRQESYTISWLRSARKTCWTWKIRLIL